METAKIFKNGHGQAIRLPKKFRLSGDRVGITHLGNAILLQPLPNSWLGAYAQMVELPNFMDACDDFLLQERDTF